MGRRRKTDKYLPERVYQRSGTFYFVDADGKWINLGKDYQKALIEYGNLTEKSKYCRTIGDLITRYLQEESPTKAAATHRTNVTQSKFLRAAFGEMRIEDLTPRAIYQYMDARGEKSPVRANRELAMLSHMYKKAIRWGLADHNPCLGIERFPEKPRERYIEDWEYLAFREFAGPKIAAYMDFKLLTGLRQKDVLSLRKSDLREDGIHVTVSKSQRPIIIAWTPLLVQAVEAAAALQTTEKAVTSMYLFCTRKGLPYTSNGFRAIWQRKMVKALKEGVLKERFRDHDLRGKTGSDTNLEHATRLLSHLDSKTTEKHYRRKTPVVTPLK